MRTMLVAALAACSAPSEPSRDSVPDAGAGGSSAIDAPPTTATCEGRGAQPLDATWQVAVGARQRVARVHVPGSYDPTRPIAVVLNVHGFMSSAAQQASLSHAVAKSDAEGFVVIHPDGVGAQTTNDEDAAFLRALLDEAAARLCVDPDRVFSMGLSNGGNNSYRLACDVADRLAAVGSVAGMLATAGCAPARPLPVFQVHGTSDSLVSYARARETVEFWRTHNQCSTMQTTYQQGDASCVTHSGCAGGAEVVLCTISGGGHQWPGGEALPFLGHKSDNLNATDAIWSFFAAHPR